MFQLNIFTADCLCHPIQMAGVETIWELYTLPVINLMGHVSIQLDEMGLDEMGLAR